MRKEWSARSTRERHQAAKKMKSLENEVNPKVEGPMSVVSRAI